LKRFSLPIQILVFALIVSACSARIVPQATSAVVPLDLQVTAVAAAYTIVAQTQAAIPTSTPPPSPTVTATNTPNATTTLPPLPTLGATFTPSPIGSGPVDPCINALLPDTLTGNPIKIRVDNPTQGTINLSVYLQSGNPQGVCGYRGYTLAAGGSLVISDLVEGCYTLWAWNPDPNAYFMVTNGTSCLNSSRSWTFDILPNDSIRLRE
jgi:hypothetical protein